MDDVNTQNQMLEGMNYYQPQQTENALKIRLENEDTLEKIEMYLTGESWAYDTNNRLVKVDDSNAKANSEGIRAIMSSISSYINKSVVQGNLSSEQIAMVMGDFHKGMANLFSFHCGEWGINRDERKSIINFIEPFVFIFITRTKDNKERESYNMAIRESGRQTFDTSRKPFNLFGIKS